MTVLTKPYSHKILIAINVLIFILQTAGWDYRIQGSLRQPETPMYHIYQWLTHMFLHDSVPHIMFNMWALGMFSVPLLHIWTERKFLLLYFVSGLIAAMVYLPFGSEQVMLLGASGAVYGLLGAFAVCFPRVPLALLLIPISIPAKYFVAVIVVYEIFAQFSGISLFGTGIAHMAHVGGAVVGALFGLWWRHGILTGNAVDLRN
ncbi:rhomboid family intramembrane serine protease [Wielerella bovis]|uniref:rhomboid family intramembrane serine protease n=1 Tax=Wielerella bovis TaxID=2917790 RepID=UPI002019C416|nr:rhomboid family intramembrane serine protease [Wielerella bovis]ULJ68583.1 rhomboid family intramembrane serine protease [Wielerella bovis]